MPNAVFSKVLASVFAFKSFGSGSKSPLHLEAIADALHFEGTNYEACSVIGLFKILFEIDNVMGLVISSLAAFSAASVSNFFCESFVPLVKALNLH